MSTDRNPPAPTARAQSHVVGVALLLAITVAALGGLTASVGSIVEDQTGRMDAKQVAEDFEGAIRPTETTGYHEQEVTFASGRLATVDRDLRVLNGSGHAWTISVGGLVYTSGEQRVATVGGAVVRETGGSGWVVRGPPVVASNGPGVLVVGAPRLGGRGIGISGSGGVTATLRTNVTHDRTRLGNDTYRVAIETTATDALARAFERHNATTTTRDFDGDGVESVVARYHGNRTAYLVVHDMRLEVGHG
ncbi:MAG: type IV pilin [Haloarculaceae archaeon]